MLTVTKIIHTFITEIRVQHTLSSPICFSSSGGNEYNYSYFLLGYITLILGNSKINTMIYTFIF